MPLKEWFPPLDGKRDDIRDDSSAKPWGLWATLGFSAMIFALFSALQILVATAFVSLAKAEHPELDLETYAKDLSSNGFCIAIMTVVSGLICALTLSCFTKLRRIFPSRNICGLKSPKKESGSMAPYSGSIFIAIRWEFTPPSTDRPSLYGRVL
jgi:hypothetical protein